MQPIRAYCNRYPDSMIAIAEILSRTYQKSDIAAALLVHRNTLHRWLVRGKGFLDGVDGHAAGALLIELVDDCESRGFPLRERLEKIGVSAGRKPAGHSTADHVLAHDVHAISSQPLSAKQLSKFLAKARQVSSRSVRERIRFIREEIDEHYYRNLNCEHMAGVAAMPKDEFIEEFREEVGLAPEDYVMLVRIRKATKLFSIVSQPFDSVALAVGFDTKISLFKAVLKLENVVAPQ